MAIVVLSASYSGRRIHQKWSIVGGPGIISTSIFQWDSMTLFCLNGLVVIAIKT